MKLFRKNSWEIWTDLLPLIAIAVCVLVVSVGFTTVSLHYNDSVTDISEGWLTSAGETVSLDELPHGELVLTRSLEGIDTDGMRLCFKSADSDISAAFDGVTTYTYEPRQAALLGKSSGMYIHMIRIPRGSCEVTLTVRPIYESVPVYIMDAAIEDAAKFMGDIYYHGLPGFSVCVIIALFGVLMLIIGIATHGTGDGTNVNFFSLGTFAILAGLWSANDTYIMQAFTQHPEVVRFVNYLCMMFIAYLPVSFMAHATNNRDTVMLPVLLGLTAVNFTLTMILSLLGVSDVRLMLPFSHVNIAISLVTTVWLMRKAVKKKTVDRSFMRTVHFSMGAAVVGVIIDLIRFAAVPDSPLGSSFATRIGVLIFVIGLGRYLMKERTRLAVERGRTELMKKLAYTDGLTGFANRAAFHEKEDELRSKRTPCIIVQLDINYLKKVNDVYGHAEGDRHIINAAAFISGSFEELGICYRTGGDEFIVVAEGAAPAEAGKALDRLSKKAADYNEKEKPPVPMQIASGYASFPGEADQLEAAEKLADDRMYERKREMKALSLKE